MPKKSVKTSVPLDDDAILDQAIAQNRQTMSTQDIDKVVIRLIYDLGELMLASKRKHVFDAEKFGIWLGEYRAVGMDRCVERIIALQPMDTIARLIYASEVFFHQSNAAKYKKKSRINSVFFDAFDACLGMLKAVIISLDYRQGSFLDHELQVLRVAILFSLNRLPQKPQTKSRFKGFINGIFQGIAQSNRALALSVMHQSAIFHQNISVDDIARCLSVIIAIQQSDEDIDGRVLHELSGIFDPKKRIVLNNPFIMLSFWSEIQFLADADAKQMEFLINVLGGYCLCVQNNLNPYCPTKDGMRLHVMVWLAVACKQWFSACKGALIQASLLESMCGIKQTFDQAMKRTAASFKDKDFASYIASMSTMVLTDIPYAYIYLGLLQDVLAFKSIQKIIAFGKSLPKMSASTNSKLLTIQSNDAQNLTEQASPVRSHEMRSPSSVTASDQSSDRELSQKSNKCLMQPS